MDFKDKYVCDFSNLLKQENLLMCHFNMSCSAKWNTLPRLWLQPASLPVKIRSRHFGVLQHAPPPCIWYMLLNPNQTFVSMIYTVNMCSDTKIKVEIVIIPKCQITEICFAMPISKWWKHPSCIFAEGQGEKKMEESLSPRPWSPQEVNSEHPLTVGQRNGLVVPKVRTVGGLGVV